MNLTNFAVPRILHLPRFHVYCMNLTQGYKKKSCCPQTTLLRFLHEHLLKNIVASIAKAKLDAAMEISSIGVGKQGCFFAAVIISLALMILTRRLTHPLEELVQGAEQNTEHGNFDPKRKRDPIGKSRSGKKQFPGQCEP